jgi:hypothetical protein
MRAYSPPSPLRHGFECDLAVGLVGVSSVTLRQVTKKPLLEMRSQQGGTYEEDLRSS